MKDSEDAEPRGRLPNRARRYFLLAVAGSATAALLGAATRLPEFILFRQRLFFSISAPGENVTLYPFDQETHDGLTLRSWYNPAENGKPTIVYFAGRDGDLLRKPAHLYRLAEEGYGLLLVGYRGYGGNPGYPSERNMFLDASSLLAQAQDKGIAPNGYVIYGYSMGTAIAANAAAQVRPRGLILEAPISRFIEAVRQQAAFVPSWLVRTRFDNRSRLAELDMPVLLLAGGRDAVTPPGFARSLASVNQRHATVRIFDDANHFSIIRLGGGDAVRDFVDQLLDEEEENVPQMQDVRSEQEPDRS